MDVREATAADEEAVVALWQACGLVVAYNDPASDFRFALGRANSAVLVCDDLAGLPIGSIMVGHDGHRGWFYYVASHPDHRRQGIGRMMVEAAEHWLAARHIPKAQLLIRETNAAVVRFYERLGYDVAPRIVMQKPCLFRADRATSAFADLLRSDVRGSINGLTRL